MQNLSERIHFGTAVHLRLVYSVIFIDLYLPAQCSHSSPTIRFAAQYRGIYDVSIQLYAHYRQCKALHPYIPHCWALTDARLRRKVRREMTASYTYHATMSLCLSASKLRHSFCSDKCSPFQQQWVNTAMK